MSLQDRALGYIDCLNKELSKYPYIIHLERHSGIPKAYAVVAIAGLYLALIIFNYGGQLLTNFAGFVIPGYYSLAALFTTTKDDDTQWLTYWVVFACFTVIESLVNVVYWFPFYFVFKFIFLLWLSLPMFRGAEIVFRSFLVPAVGRYFTQPAPASAGLRTRTGSLDKVE